MKIIKGLDPGTAGVLACPLEFTAHVSNTAGEDACGPSIEIPGGVR